MKSFKQYLTEGKKDYTFRIKLINEIDNESVDRIETHLAKYEVKSVQAPKRLMLQSAPYDFPQARGHEVHVIEFTTARPASAYQIQEELKSLLGLGDGVMKVRSDMEPLEQQEMAETSDEPKDGSLLEDPDYKEMDAVKGEDFYGDKYNTSFVQELLKLRDEKDKEKDK